MIEREENTITTADIAEEARNGPAGTSMKLSTTPGGLLIGAPNSGGCCIGGVGRIGAGIAWTVNDTTSLKSIVLTLPTPGTFIGSFWKVAARERLFGVVTSNGVLNHVMLLTLRVLKPP